MTLGFIGRPGDGLIGCDLEFDIIPIVFIIILLLFYYYFMFYYFLALGWAWAEAP